MGDSIVKQIVEKLYGDRPWPRNLQLSEKEAKMLERGLKERLSQAHETLQHSDIPMGRR